MTTRMTRVIAFTSISLSCLFQAASAVAGNPEIDQLRQQMEMLIKQNGQLTQRLSEMEEKLKTHQLPDSTVQKTVKSPDGSSEEAVEENSKNINESVSLSGSVEGDMIFAKDFTGNKSSEFSLATVELIFDARATDWSSGTIVVDYDGEDGGDLYIDEANITLGNSESFPLFLTAGKIYAPFGDFSTNMLQDSMTQTIGEINDPGVIIGIEINGITGSLFGYKGMSETGTDDTIQGGGASLAYSYEKDDIAVNTGISWVRNIADSGGITDVFNGAGRNTISSHISGLSINIAANYGAFLFIGEYASALDRFTPTELTFGAGGAKPSAWNSEIAYTSELWARDIVFAAGYQGSHQALALGLPEQRFLSAVTLAILPDTSLTLEYYHDKDYPLGDGGTGENGYGFTTRLAYEF